MAKPQWTIDQIKEGLEKFFNEHGRYPTSTDIDEYPHLPTTRTLERRFGGLVKVRETLKLKQDYDLRKGSHSSERAFIINKRAHKTEQTVYDYLLKRFGKEFIHREYLFTDDARTRADFFVYDNKKGFCVDVFYPNSTRNLGVCVNAKLQKYRSTDALLEYPVIFLQMNKDIKQETINELVKNKKQSLPGNYRVMDWDSFESFCEERHPIKALYN